MHLLTYIHFGVTTYILFGWIPGPPAHVWIWRTFIVFVGANWIALNGECLLTILARKGGEEINRQGFIAHHLHNLLGITMSDWMVTASCWLILAIVMLLSIWRHGLLPRTKSRLEKVPA